MQSSGPPTCVGGISASFRSPAALAPTHRLSPYSSEQHFTASLHCAGKRSLPRARECPLCFTNFASYRSSGNGKR
eukprot:6207339-Pleurochrysis_carterae.AAC.1